AARQAIADANAARGAKPALGAMKRAAPEAPAAAASSPPPATAPVASTPEPPSEPEAAAPAPAGGELTSADLTRSWDDVLKQLRPRTKGMFTSGRVMGVDGGAAVVGFPTQTLVDMAEGMRPDVESALAATVGHVVRLQLVVDSARGGGGEPGGPATPIDPEPDDDVPPDVSELVDAPPAEVKSPLDHLTSAFPGAEVLDDKP
ncbi:MAG: dnaX, partial [Actinomycetia bacterium]|nr:dnaX [Actinomycetes bacterium]